MSSLVFHHGPNRVTESATPGDTSWHKLTLPASLPPKSGRVNCVVAIATVAAAGGAGSMALVDFDKGDVAPTVGWPLLTSEAFEVNNDIWYQLTTSTDIIYFLFSF